MIANKHVRLASSCCMKSNILQEHSLYTYPRFCFPAHPRSRHLRRILFWPPIPRKRVLLLLPLLLLKSSPPAKPILLKIPSCSTFQSKCPACVLPYLPIHEPSTRPSVLFQVQHRRVSQQTMRAAHPPLYSPFSLFRSVFAAQPGRGAPRRNCAGRRSIARPLRLPRGVKGVVLRQCRRLVGIRVRKPGRKRPGGAGGETAGGGAQRATT